MFFLPQYNEEPQNKSDIGGLYKYQSTTNIRQKSAFFAIRKVEDWPKSAGTAFNGFGAPPKNI